MGCLNVPLIIHKDPAEDDEMEETVGVGVVGNGNML